MPKQEFSDYSIVLRFNVNNKRKPHLYDKLVIETSCFVNVSQS